MEDKEIDIEELRKLSPQTAYRLYQKIDGLGDELRLAVIESIQATMACLLEKTENHESRLLSLERKTESLCEEVETLKRVAGL